jgi:hypothetical protein
MRVLVLGAYRDVDPIPGEPLREALAEVLREPVSRRLELRGLSEPEVGEYVELAATELASPELVSTLSEETEGNPLFVGEIVRLLSVEGVPGELAQGAPFAIPQRVGEVIARRLTHLSEECNRVLLLAAVLGREFDLKTVARLSDLEQPQLLEILDEAMTARVVGEVPAAPGRLRFAHVLIRDTLYHGLTAARRVQHHRRVVETLEDLHGDDPGPHLGELAHHSLAGSDFDRCLRYAWRAGDRALHLLAYEEGARLYGTALEALELTDAGDEAARCRLLLSLGEAEARAGDTPAARRASLEAADIARRLGLPRELARAAAGYGGRFSWIRAGSDARIVPLLEEGLAALPGDDVELRVRILSRLAGALRDEPNRDRRDRLSAEAVELARRSGDAASIADALIGRAGAVVGPDTLEEVRALGTEAKEIAEAAGDRERACDGLFIRLLAEVQAGDMTGAERDLVAVARIAGELRQPTQLWEVRSARAMIELAAGRLEDGERLSEEALGLGERAQPAEAIPVHRVQRYTLRDFRGGLEEVEAEIEDLVVRYPARTVFRCVLAHLWARTGRAAAAAQALEELGRDEFAAVPFDQEWLFAVSLLAETAALVDAHGSAEVLYRLLSPYAACNACDYAEGTRGSMARYLGRLAVLLGRADDAARHFDVALDLNARMGARPWLAHTRHDYAQFLAARGEAGDAERARELAAEAVAGYRELGMDGWAAAVSV